MASAGQIQDVVTLRNLKRYGEILGVLMRYGMSEALANLGQGRLISAEISPTSIRSALCELGPAYIKIGQALSSRPEILSRPYREELAKLRDEVTPTPLNSIRNEVERELGGALESIFTVFDEEPIASGSIGQVHRARLLDGTDVVVKVQRPGLKESVICDSEIVRSLIESRSHRTSSGDKISRLITEFLSLIEAELDYDAEADNMDRFLWQYEGDPNIGVPRAIRSHSTRRILTMSYLPGQKLANMLAPTAHRKNAAKLLAHTVTAQIFQHGYFHGDPHGANIAVSTDGNLAFYDFGVVGELAPDERRLIAQMLLALHQQQSDTATSALLQMATSADPIDVSQLREDLAVFTATYFQTTNRIAAHSFLLDILAVTEKHGLVLPAGFYLLVRALVTLEGTGRELDPAFDLAQLSLPALREAAALSDRPVLDTANLPGMAGLLINQLENLPAAVKDTVLQLNQGRLRIQFEHRGLEGAVRSHNHSSRRLGLLVLLSAVTLGAFGFLCALIVSRMIPLRPAIISGACIASCTLALSMLICTVGQNGMRAGK